MPYIIDGNNLIGHISPEKLKDPKAKISLADQLSVFQRIKRTKVYLVFDGRPDPESRIDETPGKGFYVIFPSTGENADSVIKNMISKHTDLRRLFVVSSDRDIAGFARKKGAKAVDCKDFHRQIKHAMKIHKKHSEMKKDVSPPSPLEIDQWLKIFKKKDD